MLLSETYYRNKRNFGIGQFNEWFHDQSHLPTNRQELH